LGYLELTEPSRYNGFRRSRGKQIRYCWNRKHITLISQKLEIIRRLESSESQREVMALYSIELSTVSDIKKWKDQLRSLMTRSESVRTFSSNRH
jgi:hypothetical protein